jgi:hypothetical protein
MLNDLPGFRHLSELLRIARRHNAILNDITDRSEAQYAYRLINLLIDEYLEQHLFGAPRYAEAKRLNRHEYQVFSQNGEDGILAEVFNRIGTTNRTFIEFGVEDGNETNTINLLIKGWRGAWIEADSEACKAIRGRYASLIKQGHLRLLCEMITAENIEALLADTAVPEDIDLLSIDIDGNDYWVWKAINRYRPRVVVIEYNATFRPDTEWIMAYDPKAVWDRTSYYGASLKSLELLGNRKGYALVGCSFIGGNAFFVRHDLVADHFAAPFTAENHYEPLRLHLWRKAGHRRRFGEFTRDPDTGSIDRTT